MLEGKQNKGSFIPAIIIIVSILGVVGYLIFSNTKNEYVNNNTNNEETIDTDNNDQDNNNNDNNNDNTNDQNNNNDSNNNNNNNNQNNNGNNNNNNQNNNNNSNNNNQNNNVAVKSISVSPSSKEIKVGESFTLKVNYNPSNATNKKLTLKTSNKNVATIDKNLKVVGVKEGTATITIKSANGKTTTCTVKVVAKQTVNKNAEIKYSKTKITKIVGERPFKNTLTNTGSGTNITYSSSNPKVAIVDKDGIVKLVSVGTTTITATIKDSNYKTKTASYVVTTKFNRIAYSEIRNSGKWINSKEHVSYAAKSSKFDSVKVDLRHTEDGYLVLCHDAGFTLTGKCDLKKDNL